MTSFIWKWSLALCLSASSSQRVHWATRNRLFSAACVCRFTRVSWGQSNSKHFVVKRVSFSTVLLFKLIDAKQKRNTQQNTHQTVFFAFGASFAPLSIELLRFSEFEHCCRPRSNLMQIFLWEEIRSNVFPLWRLLISVRPKKKSRKKIAHQWFPTNSRA